MARGHYIKPNHKCETLQHAIFVDTETDEQTLDHTTTGHVLRQGWAAYVRRLPSGKWSKPEWYFFEDKEKFWSWVELRTRPKTRLYIFCHNSSFDYPVLDAFHVLPSRGWKPDRLVIEAPPTIIRLRSDNRTLLLLDTLNWWRVPLAKLGTSLGLPKLTMPTKEASQNEWDDYNKRDVEIICEAVTRWADLVRDRDLGGFQPTLAGQSFSAWRHRFMPTNVLIDDHADALACSRDCYHGGRVEAHYIGHLREPVTLLDINSMYPYVMQAHTYPTKLAYYSKNITVAKLKHLLKRYKVCAHVTITTKKPAIGVYQAGRYVFPTGTFECYISTPELEWVLRHGVVVNVLELAAYDHADIFSDFVHTMYRWRREATEAGDDVQAMMVKIIMNSLYGKFGQRGIRYEDEYSVDTIDLATWTHVHAPTGEVEHYRQLMGMVQRLHKDEESANSHPAIAAHVTAEARMLLYNYMETAGHENVFYCDTDSLLVNHTGLSRLNRYIDNTQLGKLKFEGAFDDCDLYGAKDYRLGVKVRTKGVRPSALWTSPNTVEQEKWSGLKGLLRNGQLDMPTTMLINKTLSREYLKGHVLPGGRVVPWDFPADNALLAERIERAKRASAA